MPKNKISVVLPTFNREWCISDAIRSIRGQTYDNWELIIVDDGSTDGTPELMKWWTGQDERIKHIRRDENKGIAFTRNQGIKEADGKLIAVMDSDDIMLVERLMSANQLYNEKKYDVLYASYYLSDSRGQPKELIEVTEEFTDDLLEPTQKIPHFTMVVTREIALRVPYQNQKRVNDDWFWCVDLYNAGARFVGMKEPTMIMRMFNSGASTQNRKLYDKDYKEYKINPKLRKQNESNT
jgi:teichuronic acid biosynthesis glycosyltransferase TuaG